MREVSMSDPSERLARAESDNGPIQRPLEQEEAFAEFVRSNVPAHLHVEMFRMYRVSDHVTIDLRDDLGRPDYAVVAPFNDWWFDAFVTKEEAESWCETVGLTVKRG